MDGGRPWGVWFTCVRVRPLVSGMAHQDQREVSRQMKEKVKRVGEMPNVRQRSGITLVDIIWKKDDDGTMGTLATMKNWRGTRQVVIE